MRYSGGKSKIARYLAPLILDHARGRDLWEPFCGGLGMTEYLASHGRLVASDIHPGLIALYRKMIGQPDWLDGYVCTPSDHAFAKTLADDDPIKAFIGFGCSFGGKWFGSYANGLDITGKPNVLSSVGGLKRKIDKCVGLVSFECLSFFDIPPSPGVTLYLDPPYRGTTLAGSAVFDHELFYCVVESWARKGSVALVSEYACPIGVEIWSRKKAGYMGMPAQRKGSGDRAPIERLFRVG